MAQIVMPQMKKKDDNDIGRFLGVLGGGVGAVIGAKAGGGPAGALAGASAGIGVGQSLGNMFAQNDQSQQMQNVQPSSDDAVGRRIAAAKSDRLQTLREAEASLPKLPQDMREQYAPAIVQALMAEEKRRMSGGGMA